MAGGNSGHDELGTYRLGSNYVPVEYRKKSNSKTVHRAIAFDHVRGFSPSCWDTLVYSPSGFESIPMNNVTPLKLDCYADADWANSADDRKSVTAVLPFLCSAPVSWLSKGQATVALSPKKVPRKDADTNVVSVR